MNPDVQPKMRRLLKWVVPTAAALCLAMPASAQARFSAGAGRAEITIATHQLPLDGFTVQHDPLHARVLLLDDGTRSVAIAVVDLTSITGDAIVDMKSTVARTTGAQAANIWIVAGHSFSAPHMFGSHVPPGITMSPDEQQRSMIYRKAVLDAVARAATQAKNGLRPARIGFGQGTTSVNTNRNVESADGWWLGASDTGPSDKAVSVVRVEDANHRAIANLVNYAVQSSVMDHSVGKDGGKGITSDLGGSAMRYMERQDGDRMVSLFLTGAAGDQAPAFAARRNVYNKDGRFRELDIGDAGYLLVDLQGERLGTEAARVSTRAAVADDRPVLDVRQGAVQLGAQERPRDLQQLHATRVYPNRVSGKAEAPYYLLRIGNLAIVGVQVELSTATGMDIKRRSPFAHTIVATMVNGAAKYLPDADSYRKSTYEAMNSSYGPGSAEALEAQILAELQAMHDAAPR